MFTRVLIIWWISTFDIPTIYQRAVYNDKKSPPWISWQSAGHWESGVNVKVLQVHPLLKGIPILLSNNILYLRLLVKGANCSRGISFTEIWYLEFSSRVVHFSLKWMQNTNLYASTVQILKSSITLMIMIETSTQNWLFAEKNRKNLKVRWSQMLQNVLWTIVVRVLLSDFKYHYNEIWSQIVYCKTGTTMLWT